MTKTKKRLVIVGNGPISRDLSEVVDTADFVLRFNEPKAGIGLSGTKTDRIMMANSGKPMQRRLRDPHLTNLPIFRATKEIVFPYHPDIVARYFPQPNFLSLLKGRRGDWTLQSIEKFGRAGKEVRIMPPQFYLDGCKELGIPDHMMGKLFPSTGYFGIWHILNTFPLDEWRLEVCGFTWQGWQKHAWADERRWVSQKVEMGFVTIIDHGEAQDSS
jgi:hypothetical protein